MGLSVGTWAAGGLFLATAAVAASLAFGKHAAEGERDVTTTWAETTCKAVGSFYKAEDAKTHELLPRKKWGASCAATIDGLFRFRIETINATNAAILNHQAEQTEKAAVDLTAAKTNTARRVRAKHTVETINAQATGDRRDGEYLRGLNALAGLSDEPEADLGSARGGEPEGDAAERPAPMPEPSAGVPY